MEATTSSSPPPPPSTESMLAPGVASLRRRAGFAGRRHYCCMAGCEAADTVPRSLGRGTDALEPGGGTTVGPLQPGPFIGATRWGLRRWAAVGLVVVSLSTLLVFAPAPLWATAEEMGVRTVHLDLVRSPEDG